MIDTKTVEQARNIDVVAFFEKHYGFTFTQRGGEHRCQQHQSLAVKADRLSWYWHSKGIGGHGVLDYLMKVENIPFREAVEAVADTTPTAAPLQQEAEPPKTLILPEKAGIPLRLYDYLCNKRGINGEVVNTLIQEEKLYEDRRGNVVFVGFDEQNKPRFASLRGTYGDCCFRMDCAGSDKRYGFNMAACVASDRLYIFESPIDAMSHASLEIAATGDKDAWKQHNRLSLAGTSDVALILFLNKRSFVKELVFCLDNDPAGREATAAMMKKYAENGYHTSIILPKGKLKLLKSDHQSQQYRLQDDLLTNFPKRIEASKAHIEGFKADISRLETNTHKGEEGISPMTIGDKTYTDRGKAGAALLEACKDITSTSPTKIGSYRGFDMLISFDSFNKEFKVDMKGTMTHSAVLGDDSFGNITRINNAFDKIPQRLEAVEAQLQTLYDQVENAKAELERPFALEAEFTEKSARLAELDALLNMDEHGDTEPGQETEAVAAKAEPVSAKAKPSVLDTLKQNAEKSRQLFGDKPETDKKAEVSI